MEPMARNRPGTHPAAEPSTRSIVVSYLLVPATLLVLWAASEPILALALVVGAAGALTARAAYARVARLGSPPASRTATPDPTPRRA